jgi:hypothetical protein
MLKGFLDQKELGPIDIRLMHGLVTKVATKGEDEEIFDAK